MTTTSFVTRIEIIPQTSGYLVKVYHKWPDDNGCYSPDTGSHYSEKEEYYACNTADDAIDVARQYTVSDGHSQEDYFKDANV